MTREILCNKIIETTNQLGYTPTRKEFMKLTGIGEYTFEKLKLNYTKFIEETGLEKPSPVFKYRKEYLNKLKKFIEDIGYVPYQREVYENGIIDQHTIKKLGGYKNILQEIGYEYPKWRAEDWTKKEMKEAFLRVYKDKAPSIEQVYEDYQSGKLPFSTFVIRRKFGTLNAFAQYCGLELNMFAIHYYTKQEIKDMFLLVYDIDDIPPTQLDVDNDYKKGIFKFSVSMLHTKFGSYNSFLYYCGFQELNGRFSMPCIALDGHSCDSRAEKYIDDFLYNNDIEHETHPYYKDFIEGFKHNNQADWLLGDGTVVEYFGLIGYTKYEDKIQAKLKILKDNKINYIAIYPDNINRLDILFVDYLESHEEVV